MHYLFVFIAVMMIGGQICANKLYQKNSSKGTVSALVFSIASGFFSALIFLTITLFQPQVSLFSILMAAALAFITFATNQAALKALSLGSVAVYTLFLMLGGMFLPFLYGILFLDESVGAFKIVGLIIMIFSMILPLFEEKFENKKLKRQQNLLLENNPDKTEQNKSKKEIRLLFFALCFIIFVLNGFNSIVSKAHQINSSAIDTFSFLAFMQIFNCLFGAITFLVHFLKNKKSPDLKLEFLAAVKVKNILYIILYVATVSVGSYMIMTSAVTLDASILYPMISGGAIAVAPLFSRVFFKEKIHIIVLIGLILSLVAAVFFVF